MLQLDRGHPLRTCLQWLGGGGISLTGGQPEIKKLQIQLTGFLEKDTPAFCKELWKLCLSAQSSPQGVPKELLEAKKLELIQEKVYTRRGTSCAQHG